MKVNASVSDQKIMDYGLPKHSSRPETKRARTANQRIPKWAYLLFTIDPRPLQAVLDQAKAQAALDEVTLKRQEDLRARKVVAQQDYDIALANAQKSKAATEAAQVNLDYCFIKSPINGRIGLRNVDVGNLVGPSGSPLVTIQGLDPIYTDFTVAENDLPLVRKYLGGPNVK